MSKPKRKKLLPSVVTEDEILVTMQAYMKTSLAIPVAQKKWDEAQELYKRECQFFHAFRLKLPPEHLMNQGWKDMYRIAKQKLSNAWKIRDEARKLYEYAINPPPLFLEDDPLAKDKPPELDPVIAAAIKRDEDAALDTKVQEAFKKQGLAPPPSISSICSISEPALGSKAAFNALFEDEEQKGGEIRSDANSNP